MRYLQGALISPLGVSAGIRQTYLQKSLGIGTPKQILVQNETSGSTAEDSTTENNDGTFTNVALNNTASPVSGDNAPSYGSSSTLNAFSAGLAADFSGQEFTIGCWAKVSGSGVWTDGAIRKILVWLADTNNYLLIEKTNTNNQIRFQYNAGGTLKTVTYTISTTNWFRVEMVISKAGDSMKCFVDGAQVGSTQTGLGSFSAALTIARYGSNTAASGQFHSGYLYHGRYDTTVLSDSQVAALAAV
jgi:hypothetical protein